MHGGYVADAVGLGESWVVHDGRGLAFLDADGEVAKRVEVGRFNPGPPSLSVSPDGERIAWIRWRGDDRRICTQRVDEDSPREYGVSCHRYAWCDERSLVFYLNGPLRVLDVETGEASILLEGVTAARGRRLGHRTLDRYLTGRVPDVEESFAEIAVADRRVWFGASIVTLSFRWWWLPRFHGVFSIGLDGGDLRLVATVPRQEQVRDVVALAGGTVVVDTERYRRMRVVDRRRCQFGPLAAFLADGWSPMPTSSDPEFGFRLAH